MDREKEHILIGHEKELEVFEGIPISAKISLHNKEPPLVININ
jgi:hypothetical protein